MDWNNHDEIVNLHLAIESFLTNFASNKYFTEKSLNLVGAPGHFRK